MTRPRVLVADDHPLFREALAAAIARRPDLELAGAVADGRAALEEIRRGVPDVAVLDVRMPGLDGLDVLRALQRDRSPTRVLMLSAIRDSQVVYAALGAGAAGYWSKDAERDAICDAIAAVAAGAVVLSPEAQSTLAGAIREREAHERPALTARERAVLSLCAEGLSTREIAIRLGVASGTVKAHLQSVYHKLDVPDRTSAVAAALRRGLLE